MNKKKRKIKQKENIKKEFEKKVNNLNIENQKLNNALKI